MYTSGASGQEMTFSSLIIQTIIFKFDHIVFPGFIHSFNNVLLASVLIIYFA
jgi:hypothetical protein